jgi:hypothetical protein
MTINRKQLSLIHLAKSRLGLEEEDYRAILARFGRVKSAKDLDQAGFKDVMDAFTRLGFVSDFSRQNFGERPGMASSRQVAMIRSLWLEYTADTGTEASLGKWLTGKFKVSALRFLPADAARNAITALKAMNARKASKAAVRAPAHELPNAG